MLYLLEGQVLWMSVALASNTRLSTYLKLLDDGCDSHHASRLECEHRVVALSQNVSQPYPPHYV
jgi:hypothetical protein